MCKYAAVGAAVLRMSCPEISAGLYVILYNNDNVIYRGLSCFSSSRQAGQDREGLLNVCQSGRPGPAWLDWEGSEGHSAVFKEI